LLRDTTDALLRKDYATLANLVEGDERLIRRACVVSTKMLLSEIARFTVLLCVKKTNEAALQQGGAPESPWWRLLQRLKDILTTHPAVHHGPDLRIAAVRLPDDCWSEVVSFL
jgi:hypothetical protein